MPRQILYVRDDGRCASGTILRRRVRPPQPGRIARRQPLLHDLLVRIRDHHTHARHRHIIARLNANYLAGFAGVSGECGCQLSPAVYHPLSPTLYRG